MARLLYTDKPVIGLAISLTGIKVMSVDPKKWLVNGYGSLDLDPGKVQAAFDSEDGEDTYLVDNLKKLLKENIVGTISSDHAIVGIPTGKTFSRTFTIPAKEEATLSNAVELEVDQYIPIPMSSLYVDYEIISRTKDELLVVMTAAPKTLVDSILSAVRSAGLLPILVEPSINSVARVIESAEEGHLTTLIVDIGPASTDIAVLSKGAIRITGGIGIGGNTFTLELANKLGVPLDNAHQLKVLNGLNSGPKQAKITAALKPSLERITTEVRKVIRYYNERINDDEKIEQVLVVGGGSNVPGIGEYFTNELIMAARVASPWQKLDFGSLQQPSKQFRPMYITVAGLASVNREEVWK